MVRKPTLLHFYFMQSTFSYANTNTFWLLKCLNMARVGGFSFVILFYLTSICLKQQKQILFDIIASNIKT